MCRQDARTTRWGVQELCQALFDNAGHSFRFDRGSEGLVGLPYLRTVRAVLPHTALRLAEASSLFGETRARSRRPPPNEFGGATHLRVWGRHPRQSLGAPSTSEFGGAPKRVWGRHPPQSLGVPPTPMKTYKSDAGLRRLAARNRQRAGLVLGQAGAPGYQSRSQQVQPVLRQCPSFRSPVRGSVVDNRLYRVLFRPAVGLGHVSSSSIAFSSSGEIGLSESVPRLVTASSSTWTFSTMM